MGAAIYSPCAAGESAREAFKKSELCLFFLFLLLYPWAGKALFGGGRGEKVGLLRSTPTAFHLIAVYARACARGKAADLAVVDVVGQNNVISTCRRGEEGGVGDNHEHVACWLAISAG